MSKKIQVSDYEISVLCSELHLIYKSGITITDGLVMMISEQENKIKKSLLEKMLSVIENGGTLRDALDEAADMPKYFLEMIEIGERTGHTESVLSSLSQYYSRQDDMQRTIRSAVVYPTVLFITALAVIIVLAVFVLPIFNDVFASLGLTMSDSAIWLMNVGLTIGRSAALIIAVVIIPLILMIFLYKFTGFKNIVKKLFSRTKTAKALYTARFANALSMTLSSGFDIDTSMEMSSKLMSDQNTREKIDNAIKHMSNGKSFVEAINEEKLFSKIYTGMINVGFNTGTSDTVMKKIAEKSEETVARSVESLINRFEPAMVITMSVIVGFILLSVMLPLLSVMTVI